MIPPCGTMVARPPPIRKMAPGGPFAAVNRHDSGYAIFRVSLNDAGKLVLVRRLVKEGLLQPLD